MLEIIEEKYAWAQGFRFKSQNPDTIVIHHALHPNCTAQDVHQWHLEKGWQGIAYHYFISKKGKIYRGRPEDKQGGHLLGTENKNTIGICLEGCYEDFVTKNGVVFTEKLVPVAQMEALIALCGDISSRRNIKAVKRHADYPSAQAQQKLCPGTYFPWEYFMKRYRVEMYQQDIQKHMKLADPLLAWKFVDMHPYAEEWYKKWAESYKRNG